MVYWGCSISWMKRKKKDEFVIMVIKMRKVVKYVFRHARMAQHLSKMKHKCLLCLHGRG
jgi:hypothetical protein